MEVELAKELMELFFHAPAVNGILVFEDNDYLGVVLKRDIEIGIMEGNFNLFENINFMKANLIPNTIFKNEAVKNTKIPVIDKAGKLIRIISYEEFTCQFYFEDYIEKFNYENVFDYLEQPMIITNHFKKIIYANKNALEWTQKDLIGRNISPVLNQFDIRMQNSEMTIEKNGIKFRLLISHSLSKNFSYFVYQFLS